MIKSKGFLVLAFIIVAAILAHLFNPTDWPPLAIDIMHSLHGPGFAILSLLILWFLQSRSYSVVNYVLAAAIAMSIGVVSEIAQIPGPRDAEIKDLVVDALGIIGALGIRASLDFRVRRIFTRLPRLLLPPIAITALGIACIPTFWLSYALAQQEKAFPVLLDFESSWEKSTLSRKDGAIPSIIRNPEDWHSGGDFVALAKERGKWGIFLSHHPMPDWSGYTQISFTMASAAREFPVSFCIRDEKTDGEGRGNRFCTRFYAAPEAKVFTLSFDKIRAGTKSREFDFSHVEAVVFSAGRPGGRKKLLLDDVRLEL